MHLLFNFKILTMSVMKTNSVSLPGLRLAGQNIRRPAAEVRLGQSDLYRLPGDHRGEWISVLAGIVWVTLPGDPQDYLLSKGDSLLIDHKGDVVLQGMADSRLRMISR